MKRWIGLAACLVAAACGTPSGGGGGGGGDTGDDGSTTGEPGELPSNTLIEQSTIPVADWESVVAQDEQLQQVITAASSQDYDTVKLAGRVKDDTSAILHWAVLTKSTDATAERIVAKACDSEGACRSGRLDPETAAFELHDGSDGGLAMVAAPGMLKDLGGADHDGKTTLVGALTAEEVPIVDLKKRHFSVINSFGPAFGVDLSGWAALGSDSGAFTDVTVTDYARAATVQSAIESGSPFDVVVWVGASVREKLGANHKTVGMTVNRGIYGDETFTSTQVKAALKASPFGGPGIVVLVGDESRGDGSSEEEENLNLFKEFRNNEAGRIVVAIRGRAGPEKALAAAGAFLGTYLGGSSLADSITAGNAALAGTDAVLLSSRESVAAETFFVGALDGVWAEDPREVRSNHYLSVNNRCFPDPEDNTNFYSEDEGHVNFFVDVDFTGPFFTGSRTNADVGLDVQVDGVLLGTEPGSRIYLQIAGDVKLSVKGLTVWGAGQLVDEHDPDKPGRIFYDGTALATDYTNDKGDNCVLLSPSLTGSTSQPSWMDVGE